MTETNDVAQLVREARKAMGLTQRELAELADVSYQALMTLEAGDPRRGYPKLLDRLADTLGLDRDELYLKSGRLPADLTDQLRRSDPTAMRRIRKAIR